MKNNKDYQLNDFSDSDIETIAGKFIKNKERLIGKLISWETITEDYFLLSMPNDDLEHMIWVKYRPTWITTLNQYFLDFKLPIRLDVKYNIGVILYTDAMAVNTTFAKRLRKVTNTINDSEKLFNDMKESFPESKKILNFSQKLMNETLYGIYGRIENSRIPFDQKRQLKAIVQNCLPDED